MVTIPNSLLERGSVLIKLVAGIFVAGVFVWVVMAIFNPMDQIRKERDNQRKSDLKQVQNALETYYAGNRRYPLSDADYRIIDMGVDSIVSPLDWGYVGWIYLQTLPKDPSSSRKYVYVSDGQSYRLYANLERGTVDPQACNEDGSICSSVPSEAKCGASAICNYGVSSPNVSP